MSKNTMNCFKILSGEHIWAHILVHSWLLCENLCEWWFVYQLFNFHCRFTVICLGKKLVAQIIALSNPGGKPGWYSKLIWWFLSVLALTSADICSVNQRIAHFSLSLSFLSLCLYFSLSLSVTLPLSYVRGDVKGSYWVLAVAWSSPATAIIWGVMSKWKILSLSFFVVWCMCVRPWCTHHCFSQKNKS